MSLNDQVRTGYKFDQAKQLKAAGLSPGGICVSLSMLYICMRRNDLTVRQCIGLLGSSKSPVFQGAAAFQQRYGNREFDMGGQQDAASLMTMYDTVSKEFRDRSGDWEQMIQVMGTTTAQQQVSLQGLLGTIGSAASIWLVVFNCGRGRLGFTTPGAHAIVADKLGAEAGFFDPNFGFLSRGSLDSIFMQISTAYGMKDVTSYQVVGEWDSLKSLF